MSGESEVVPGVPRAGARDRRAVALLPGVRERDDDGAGRIAASKPGAGAAGRPAPQAPAAGAGPAATVAPFGSLHHHWHPSEPPDVLAAMIARVAARYVPHGSQMDEMSSPSRYSSKAGTTPQEAEDA